VDFGIAKVFDPNLKTTVGARAVTPGYSPPEQYGQGTTDAQSDVYSLGATLYHVLTNQEPPASMDVISGCSPRQRPVNLVNPKVSSEVSAAVEKAMQFDRTTRYKSAADFKSDLKPSVPKISSVQVSKLPKQAVAYQKPATPARKSRLTPLVLIIIFLVLICCCLIFVYWLWNNGDAITGISSHFFRVLAYCSFAQVF
jgi:serine/threonine protein kinase